VTHSQTSEQFHARLCAVGNRRTALLFATACAVLVIASWRTLALYKAASRPDYFVIPFNLLTIFIFGRLIVLFKCLRERFVFGLALIGQLRWLASWFAPALRNPAPWLRRLEFVLWVLAFLMSLSMVVQAVRNPRIEAERSDGMALMRGGLILLAVVVTMLLLGALVYWLPLR